MSIKEFRAIRHPDAILNGIIGEVSTGEQVKRVL
jgi:hypothetical protein